jgi:hypothetical protein
MTRKDYVKFATLIKSHECPSGSPLDVLAGWNISRNEMALRMCEWIFEPDNPNFDRARFLAACGVES